MNFRMLSGVTLAAAGLIAAGCGDDSTTSAALTKSQFVNRANAICTKGDQAIFKAAQKTFKGQPSTSEVKQFATKTVIPNIQAQINAIEALPAPSGDETQVNAILSSAQAALDKAKANPTLLTESAKEDPFAATDKLTKAYGLNRCGGT